jgi:co-chaperonin GroES (HSP10)
MPEFMQDTLNVISLEDVGVSMQAIEDKIIILVDQWKSGYECKECGGSGKVESTINPEILRTCDACKGKGQTLVIPDSAKSLPSTGVVVSMGPATQYMQAKKAVERAKKREWESKVIVPPNDYVLGVEEAESMLKEIAIQIGTRVVFGVHVGTKVPIKGNIKLVIMREKEPLCVVFGNDIGDKEIIDFSQEANT